MFNTSWFLSKTSGTQDILFRENQLLRAQVQELLELDETGFFVELDSLLKAILKKALILCKAEASFFALPQSDPSELDVRISNLILEEKMNRIREKFKSEYQKWQESENELITIDEFILLPLIRRHRMLGVIGLRLNSDAPENVCEILPILAKQAGASLESAILYERMFKRLLVLSNVFILGKEIVTNIDLTTLVDKFLSIARDGTGSEIACIFLIRDSEYKPYYARVQTPEGEGVFSDDATGFTQLISETCNLQEPVITENIPSSRFAQDETTKIKSYQLFNSLCIPMKPRDKFLGIIQVANKLKNFPYSSEDQDLLKILSSQIAFVIQNADLYRNLQKAYIDTLTALTTAIDAKDSYTHGHSQRVTRLSLALARQMNLPGSSLEDLKLAGLLHDIGKIGIPEQILNKPGRLTTEEFEVIKSHPDLGVKILGKVDFLSAIIPMIRHHHERFDGRGYPAGLKDVVIPLEARIITVADTFDAMTSDRPYRKALEPRAALEELERCKGTQFDPEIVDAFIILMENYDFEPDKIK